MPLAPEPEKHDKKQAKIDIMCAKIGQQQRENWNIFTQNLANHFNMFFYRLEGTSKDKSIPVTDAETSNPSCLKASAYNRDTQGFSLRPLLITEI